VNPLATEPLSRFLYTKYEKQETLIGKSGIRLFQKALENGAKPNGKAQLENH